MLSGCVPWPADDAARYRRAGYWQDVALGDVLRVPAREYPRQVALADTTRSLTFAEVDKEADQLAAGLRRSGLRTGDRVVVQLPNIPEFMTVTLALLRAGVLPVFALPAHRASDIRYLCEVSEAKALVVPDRHGGFDYRGLARAVRSAVDQVVVVGDAEEFTPLSALADEPVEMSPPDPSDVAFFLLSGGTTGMPKLIPRTHNDYAYQLRATAAGLGVGPTSAYLAALPVAHNAALGCPGLLGTYLAGGRTILARSPAPDEAFPLVAEHDVTLTTLMPPLVKMWVEAGALFDIDISGVLLQIGSAKLPPELARRIRPVLGCEMTHWFGMAEGLCTFTRPGEADEVVFNTTGKPLCPDDEVKVVDDDGVELGPGQIGELLTRGPYTLRGYYRADEHNKRAFTPDGWFRTGDLVRLSDAGDLVVEGRIKDVINRGGEKISPAEVEDHLLAHPDVRDVAVIGIPDPVLGERTCACVIGADRVDVTTVRKFLRDRGVASFKLPDVVEHVETFPHTKVGKVNKAELARVVGALTSR